MPIHHRFAALLIVSTFACAGSGPTGAAPKTHLPAPAPAPLIPSPQLERIAERVNARDIDGAMAAVEAMRSEAGTDPRRLDEVAWAAASVHGFRGDLDGAARILGERVPSAATRPGDATEFELHKQISWIRWAQREWVGALVEGDEMAQAIERSGVSAERRAELRKDYLWHRAYLLSEVARTGPEPRRSLTLRYADLARTAFERAADPTHDGNAIAVLKASYHLAAGEAAKARAAAARVDLKTDDDIQDLYLLAAAFDAGGDKANGDAARVAIRSYRGIHVMRPLVEHLLHPSRADDAVRDGGSTVRAR